MKAQLILSTAILTAVFAIACNKEPVSQEDGLVTANVTLNLADIQGELTKASEGLYPEVENWIFDFFYVQFNADGISVRSGHRRTNVTTGNLVVTEAVTLQTVPGNSTVTFVANVTPAGSSYSYVPNWENGSTILIADNIASYKTVKFDMTERLTQAEDGSLKHTPMCGYWVGPVTANPFDLTATLGRMIVRLNVQITNNSGAALTEVALKNAAAKAYIFPQVDNAPLDADADYMDIPANPVHIANGASTTLYFYTAPNFCNDEGGKRTSLSFTKAGGQTTSISLGNEVENGDYNLYMNTIYNYSLTVK